MSPQTIRQMSDEAAEKAAKKNAVPYVPFTPDEVLDYPPFPFPNIGSYEPPGWEVSRNPDDDEPITWFVDKTGIGGSGEPACTWHQFRVALYKFAQEHPRHGYAITEEGEMQLYITAFYTDQAAAVSTFMARLKDRKLYEPSPAEAQAARNVAGNQSTRIEPGRKASD